MFKANAKARRILQAYGTCAYIYRDGVAIREDAHTTIRGEKIVVPVTHVYPCDVQFTITNNPEGRYSVKRVVVHRAAILCSGVKRMTFFFENYSENAKRMGVHVCTTHLYAPNGTEIPLHESDILGGEITVQPGQFSYIYGGDPPDSISIYERSDETVIWHGTKEKIA